MRSALEIMQSEIKSNGTKREAKGNIKKCSKMYSHKSSQMWRQKRKYGKYLCFLTEQFNFSFTVADQIFGFAKVVSVVMLSNIFEPQSGSCLLVCCSKVADFIMLIVVQFLIIAQPRNSCLILGKKSWIFRKRFSRKILFLILPVDKQWLCKSILLRILLSDRPLAALQTWLDWNWLQVKLLSTRVHRFHCWPRKYNDHDLLFSLVGWSSWNHWNFFIIFKFLTQKFLFYLKEFPFEEKISSFSRFQTMTGFGKPSAWHKSVADWPSSTRRFISITSRMTGGRVTCKSTSFATVCERSILIWHLYLPVSAAVRFWI